GGAGWAARHSPTLAWLSTKSPPCFTRIAACTQFTVTQGCGGPLGGNGQPAIVNVSDLRRTGAPALARVLPGTAMTVPPCGHISVLAVVSNAGITSPPMRRC